MASLCSAPASTWIRSTNWRAGDCKRYGAERDDDSHRADGEVASVTTDGYVIRDWHSASAVKKAPNRLYVGGEKIRPDQGSNHGTP